MASFDVVVVGAGGAGVAAAISAARLGARVAVVTKEPVGYGNTRVAMGALAAGPLLEGDSTDLFLADMIRGGEGLNHPLLAQAVASGAPEAINLVERYGHVFRRDEAGRLTGSVATRAGGHSFARTVRSLSLGIGLGQSLRAALARASIQIFEGVVAGRIVVDDNKVQGLLGLRLADGETVVLPAKSVILATGGAGWLFYPHTSCVRSSTGDGYALALEAGAQLVDMEQVQFIPFAVTHPEAFVGLFLGEPSLAGRAGRLLNKKGEVVLTGISPMTRAQVTRAMAEETEKNDDNSGVLFLDLSPNFVGPNGEEARRRSMAGETAEMVKSAYGLKAWRGEEPWPVAPAVHFFMGGVATDEWGKSSVEGLYAAGEVAGGVHGGNRLGSVALTELFVMGRRAGEHAAEFSRTGQGQSPSSRRLAAEIYSLGVLRGTNGAHRPITLIRELQGIMWSKVGIARSEERCQEALQRIGAIQDSARNLTVSPSSHYNTEHADAIELRLMLIVAQSIALAARQRRESRGAHYRIDFPGYDDAQGKTNTKVWIEDGSLHIGLKPVPTA